MQAGVHGVEVVAGDANELGYAAVAQYAGGDAVCVAVVDHAGLIGVAGFEEFVAGGEDGDYGPAEDA